MENETATSTPRRTGRVKRWIKRGLLGLLVLVVLAAIVGASYQAIGNRADARRFPQQGKSVSLGPAFDNLSLSIDCRGARKSHRYFGQRSRRPGSRMESGAGRSRQVHASLFL